MTLPSLDFYCDESSFTASKYAAVSGIAIQSTRVSTVNAELAKLKASRGKREASPNFAINTPWEGRRATVWNWKEQKLGRPRS
jgi:hypothetical protein